MKYVLHSPKEVAAITGLKKRDVLEAIRKGELPTVKLNKRNFKISAVGAAAWYTTKGGRTSGTTRNE
ncbi:MAG: hypothetical protein AB8D78_01535 [Akkermansiaceae bacterium]